MFIGNLDSHVRRVHKLQEIHNQPIYRCSFCSCIFRKLGSLNTHLRRMHNGEKIPEKEPLKDISPEKSAGVSNAENQANIIQNSVDDQKNKKTEIKLLPNSEDGFVVSQDNSETAIVTLLDKTTNQKER